MDVELVLTSLLRHYLGSAATGHTYVAVHGVACQQSARLIVAHNHEINRIAEVHDLDHKKMIPLDRLPEAIEGLRCPIAFDNYALQRIFAEAASQISNLKNEIHNHQQMAQTTENVLPENDS